jgi:hypothetical protein
MKRGLRALFGAAVAVFVWAQGDLPLPADEAAPAAQDLAHPNTFFDPDPHHPWNELYGALFIRPGRDGKLHGLDEPDPLYWASSRYLLEEPLHPEALIVLDNFIKADAAQRIRDPLKRAILQRMLWALFDHWARPPILLRTDNTYAKERRDLQRRLVKIMKSVALTPAEIAALPRSYELEESQKLYPTTFDPEHADQPFLPGGLYAHGDWVELDGTNYDILAPVHTQSVSGRSSFHVFLNLPGGRAATLAYLKQLHDFQPHWIYDWSKAAGFEIPFTMMSDPPYLNPAIPQVPLLTKFALARTAMVLDTNGDEVSVPLTESVQVRVIRTIEPHNSSGGRQNFFMFKLDPAKFMKGGGGLVALGNKESAYDLVLGDAMDPLETISRNKEANGNLGVAPPLASCFGCHSEPGIFSMNSYIQFFQPVRSLKPPDVREGYDSAWSTIGFERDQYNWGLLQAFWADAE